MLALLLCVFCATAEQKVRPIEWWPVGYYVLSALGDGVTTRYNEKLGAEEANPGVVFVETKLNVKLFGYKAAEGVALEVTDIGFQLGARRGWWPHWLVWGFRGSVFSTLLAVLVWNAATGLHH